MTYELAERAKSFLGKVSPSSSLESLESTQEVVAKLMPGTPLPPEQLDVAESAAKKIAAGSSMTPAEVFALEAIIIPDKRPAIDIINGDYTISHKDWLHFNRDTEVPRKSNIRKVIPSVGRIELPHHPTLPYGGTGFVVGHGLLMTNRHVAEIFSSGLGIRNVVFRPGHEAGVDFLRERASTASTILAIRRVAMIHPFWDMALLHVDGLPPDHVPLTLSLKHPEEMIGQDVAVIGYPAFDPRNDAKVQDTVFGGVYYVKRLQPGKMRDQRYIDSFGRSVFAATHDASTLGGNSGSAVVDPASGCIIGLHFAGVYLDANFAVPTSEFARDVRIADAGLNFERPAQPDRRISEEWWRGVETAEKPGKNSLVASSEDFGIQSDATSDSSHTPATEEVTWTIPLEITVRMPHSAVLVERKAESTAGPVEHLGSEPNPIRWRRTLPRLSAIGSDFAPQEVPGSTATDAVNPPSREQTPSVRDAASLSEGPVTFRDHFASLFQSAVLEIARKTAERPAGGLESLGTGKSEATELVLAAEKVVASLSGAPHPSRSLQLESGSVLEKMTALDRAQACAALGWELMKAKLLGDSATAARVQEELTAGTCDPLWAQTIEEYVRYFGPNGTRKPPIYVAPIDAGGPISIPSNANIGIIGDWGTGAGPALNVLKALSDNKPDVIIHLGDIYYSGTPEECRANFESIFEDVFGDDKRPLVYTLCGNHDMYCGGVGYYSLLEKLNAGEKRQKASYFSLRSEDGCWQLLAMDTGRNDYSPFSVKDVVTFVEPAEEDWHLARLQEFDGRTVLFSHHQLFSAFSQIGGLGADGTLRAYNMQLKRTFDRLAATGRPISAWFWGHEHNLCIYEPYLGLGRGRCVGHSAIPVFVDDDPYSVLPRVASPPQILPNTRLSTEGQFYSHGFAMLSLGLTAIEARYYEIVNGRTRCIYAEQIT
ncbi:V8-like Glu-specific endopeptidase [Bradyrhizobium diazoefficiens]